MCFDCSLIHWGFVVHMAVTLLLGYRSWTVRSCRFNWGSLDLRTSVLVRRLSTAVLTAIVCSLPPF